MIRRSFFLFLASLCCTLATAQGKLLINELMQSNVDFVMIEHDFPDSWVELYNGSNTTMQIEQYRIGTSNVFSEAFQLSASKLSIEPEQHLMLYCDKPTGTPFHYNFNLEAGKGELFLFDDKGVVIDSIVYGKMPAPNIAYGRVTDGRDEWQYELTSTPGASNSSVGSNEVLPEPVCQATPSRLWQQMFP